MIGVYSMSASVAACSGESEREMFAHFVELFFGHRQWEREGGQRQELLEQQSAEKSHSLPDFAAARRDDS